MLSFGPELEALEDAGSIDPSRAEKLIAIERRTLFSIHNELRIATYAAVALIVAGVGMVLKENLDRIGPLTIILVIAAAAAALYVYAFTKKRRETYSVFDEYLALLATLLVSADLGYLEQQFDLLGERGFDHLLILAIFHAVIAYALGSRLVIAVSLASLAAWFGIDRSTTAMWDSAWETGRQALFCAGAIFLWRLGHAHLVTRRDDRSAPDSLASLTAPMEHYIANLCGFAACAFAAEPRFEWTGIGLTLLFAIFTGMLAVKRRSELFLLYTLGYGLTGISIPVIRHIGDEVLGTLYLLLVFVFAIVTLFVAHIRWRFDK